MRRTLPTYCPRHRPRQGSTARRYIGVRCTSLRCTSLLCASLLCGALLSVTGCDEASRARRAERRKPLDRYELPVPDDAPVRVFTSRTGPQPSGRPQSVYIEVQMRVGVLSIATEIRGVDGIKVDGGGRRNHGSAGRTRLLSRAITAQLTPGSHGRLDVRVAWRTSIETREQRIQLVIDMPAAAAPQHP